MIFTAVYIAWSLGSLSSFQKEIVGSTSDMYSCIQTCFYDKLYALILNGLKGIEPFVVYSLSQIRHGHPSCVAKFCTTMFTSYIKLSINFTSVYMHILYRSSKMSQFRY